MTKKLIRGLVSILILTEVFFLQSPAVLATAVDRLALCNLEGLPGTTIDAQITLEGDSTEEREGFWYTHYKEVEGDDERMDITSWITIEPVEYTISQGESITFTINAKIPEDAKPGLWGATSEDAWQQGHSAERRTYLIFKDTPIGGNVYSGLLIPVSVLVLEESSQTGDELSPAVPAHEGPPLTENESQTSSALDFIKDNIIVIALGIVVIILVVLLIVRTRARNTG